MERLQQYRVPVFTAIGALVVAVIVLLAWISPEGSKLSTLRAQQTQLGSQQASLQAEIATLQREKADFGPTCSSLAKYATEIPPAPDVDSFFKQVTALAVSSGDPNTPSISVGGAAGSTQGSSSATPVAIAFTLDGTYGQMSAFLEGLYSFPRMFTISQVTIGAGPGAPVAKPGGAPAASSPGFSLSLDGSIYYSTGPADVCGVSS
jgi:Tfp pilus assembly protein PilO